MGIRCDGGHTHTELLGGRARAAARYPPELVLAIIRGLQARREADARARGEKMPCSEALVQAVAVDRAAWNDKIVLDEYTGEPLDTELVRKGKDEGMWEVVPRSRAAGRRLVGTRWVCSNKGARRVPRYVAA